MGNGVRVMRRLFTVEEYYEMGRAGILTEEDRVELIEGEIVRMSPIGNRHAACVDRIARILFARSKDRAHVRIQNPVRLSRHSEPQPDVSLLRPRSDFYAGGHPGPEETLLVIEVADTTLESDRELKLPLYARAGIREVWLVDLDGDAIEVCRAPVEGKYEDAKRLSRGATLSPLELPELSVRVEEILG